MYWHSLCNYISIYNFTELLTYEYDTLKCQHHTTLVQLDASKIMRWNNNIKVKGQERFAALIAFATLLIEIFVTHKYVLQRIST